MYPPKPEQYYPSAPPPPPAMGVPSGQYYSPAAPMGFQTPPQRPTRWSTGLCACTEDCGNCCMTCFCPCVTFGRIAEIVDKGSTSCGTSGTLYTLLHCFTCCHWIYSCSYRSKLRGQYNLLASPCNDCLLHCCCEPCALCQEYRELKNHGFDMKIGWYGNEARHARGVNLPPVVQGSMMR